jgi:glycerol-3-phosphate dehydrogenase (NAD(P)+)
MDQVAVIGSGSWGTAVALMLARNGKQVRLWSWKQEEAERLSRDRENKEFLPDIAFPENIFCSSDMKKCLEGSRLAVLASPSHAIRQTAKTMAPFFQEGGKILIISKGLEEGSLLTLSQVVASEIPHATVAVMSGPSHAEEVAISMPTTNVVASRCRKTAEEIQDIFMNDVFRVYTHNDVLGVELGGAIKNVIALCAGIADGLGFGDNSKAALMTRGIAEIARLGVAMGAQRETFSGLSGIGDLIVTCTSMHSRNRRAGILIGQGVPLSEALEKVHMVVEGVKTTSAAYELAQKYNVNMPIVSEAYKVLFEGKSPKKAVTDLMLREKKRESESDELW